jgi:prephenate dehydrogenase
MLGASPFFLNADEHDGLITAVDYLPSLMSVALVNMLSRQKSWRETRKLAGKIFERVSFGADGDPDTLTELFFENKATLIHWLDHYIAELNSVKQMLLSSDEADETMAQEIDQAIVARLNWLKDFEKGSFLDPELSSPKVENPGLLSQMIGFGGFRKDPSKDKKEQKR